MANLILCDHDNVTLNQNAGRLVGAALHLGGPVDLLVAGHGCAKAAEQARQIANVRNVLVLDDERLQDKSPEALSAVLLSLAGAYRAFIGATSTAGRRVMPHLAALLNSAQISDVTAIVSSDTFEHPIYAGNAIEVVRATGNKIVLTVRASSFEPSGRAHAPASLVPVSAPDQWPAMSKIIARSSPQSERPELSSAKIVVSGGRGFGSKARFEELLHPLADRLGAALGASRAAVDAGYAPNDWQVGQTGKIVAPDIYVAVGISGAIQHLAGIKDAKVIVAINKDADAAIFEVADFGLVGDLTEVLPALIDKLQPQAG